ncbi:propionate--CoA ligase, partial [Vibrio cholerae]|nr:propionate--CoA ligase [Vibrio cholerae]MVB43875.1 propionate--CoA ligase [Vibrio cholerae]MVC01645.1 propionate--CoA ligase [Vibrio cholerae]
MTLERPFPWFLPNASHDVPKNVPTRIMCVDALLCVHHAISLKYSMQIIYNMPQDGVFWAASDVGWVVGHSYIVYAPLIHGCTTLLYEGKPVRTPDPGAFWRVCQEYQVTALFSAPTAFRAIKKEDPNGD